MYIRMEETASYNEAYRGWNLNETIRIKPEDDDKPVQIEISPADAPTRKSLLKTMEELLWVCNNRVAGRPISPNEVSILKRVEDILEEQR